MIGADGEADYTNGILTHIFSTDPGVGVGTHSTISGPKVNGVLQPGGSGDNIVIGGSGSDTIVLGGAANKVIGDNGEAFFDAAGTLTSITTTNPADAGDNIITVTGGNNVIFGGAGNDTITVQTVSTVPSGNVIVGDDGTATFTSGVLTRHSDADRHSAAPSTITTGDGNNVIIGGSGATRSRSATATAILGDNGSADFSLLGVLIDIPGSDPVYGGDDVIRAGNGNNVIIGGAGSDRITAGNGSNVVVGNDGAALYTAAGVLTTIETRTRATVATTPSRSATDATW